MAILTVPADDELDVFLRAYDAGTSGISGLRGGAVGIEAGTVNSSFALDLDGVRHFLRIYEEQGEAGARSEAALLLHLAEHGVATPAPVRARDGELVRILAGKPAVLFPWVEGTMLCQKSVTEGVASAVGAALARVHRVGAPAGAALGPGRFGPSDLLARCVRVDRSSDREAAAEGGPLRALLEASAEARRADVPVGLVHGDLFRDNVLWHRGSIAALLDFESAHLGPFAYDIAVTILSWAFDDDFVPAVARAIVDGYRRERELTDEEREALWAEAVFAAVRFTVTRITDNAIRVGKCWQRFAARRRSLEAMGPTGFQEMCGL